MITLSKEKEISRQYTVRDKRDARHMRSQETCVQEFQLRSTNILLFLFYFFKFIQSGSVWYKTNKFIVL